MLIAKQCNTKLSTIQAAEIMFQSIQIAEEPIIFVKIYQTRNLNQLLDKNIKNKNPSLIRRSCHDLQLFL